MRVLQRVDKRLGPLACVLAQPMRWLRPWLRRSTNPPERLLMVKFWGVGSLQLLTPAARHLRRANPRARVVLLTLAGHREAATRMGVFDSVLAFDVTGAGPWQLCLRSARLIRELRRWRFDAVYDFEFFTRFSALVSLLSGAPRSHGFGSTSVWRGGFHTHTTPFNRYWHVARNFRSLAGGEDGAQVVAADVAPLRFDPDDVEVVDQRLRAVGMDPCADFAVLNPNAGELNFERRWPRASFAKLARRLSSELGLRIVLIGSRGEREYTDGVVVAGRELAVDVASLAGELTSPQLAALLARCAVFVTNDSGPMHVAAALGTPTVGLFGPETPLLYGPLGPRARALYRPPACSPCINVHDNKVASCIYGSPQCLVALEVDEVFEASKRYVRGEDWIDFELPRPSPAPSEPIEEPR